MALGPHRCFNFGFLGDPGGCETVELSHVVLRWGPHAAKSAIRPPLWHLTAVETADHAMHSRILRKLTHQGSWRPVSIFAVGVCCVLQLLQPSLHSFRSASHSLSDGRCVRYRGPLGER